MMLTPHGSKDGVRRFWVVSSFIGLCVCGALMLYFAVGGFWTEAGLYLGFFLCNAWTFERKRRGK
jgi:hypothetical protein